MVVVLRLSCSIAVSISCNRSACLLHGWVLGEPWDSLLVPPYWSSSMVVVPLLRLR